MSENYQLTPVELELMEIIWTLGEGTVRDVMAKLPENRKLAYTSVSTILRILQQKKILVTKKISKQHIYQPLFNKPTFTEHFVKRMVKQIFSGNAFDLVTHLVDKNHITANEIEVIQKLLDTKKQELVK